jgi:hypothetical protein
VFHSHFESPLCAAIPSRAMKPTVPHPLAENKNQHITLHNLWSHTPDQILADALQVFVRRRSPAYAVFMQPSPKEVFDELKKILASEDFRKAPSQGKLLEYLVVQTLNRKADQLTGKVIAAEAEPGKNVEASQIRTYIARLREKLIDYYGGNRGQGASDPVVIKLPQETYEPIFEVNPVMAVQPWDWGAVLQMLQDSSPCAEIRVLSTFHDYGDLLYALYRLLIEDKDSARQLRFMLMNPNGRALLDKRYGEKTDEFRIGLNAEKARKQIRDELNEVYEWKQREGNEDRISVMVYPTVPTLMHFQVLQEGRHKPTAKDRIVVGTLLTKRAGYDGAMVTIARDTPLWSVYDENWDAIWGHATPWSGDVGDAEFVSASVSR